MRRCNLLKKLKISFLLIVFLTSSLNILYSNVDREIGFSFIPTEVNNLISINFKKLFKLYGKKDIYNSFFFKSKKKKEFLNLLFKIMRDGKIDINTQLYFMTISSNKKLELFDGEFINNLVFVIKLSYNIKVLEKSIKKNIRKKFKEFKIKTKKNNFGKIIDFKRNTTSFSIYLANERTVIIGSRKNVIKYEGIFLKRLNNVTKNKHIKPALKMMRSLPIVGFYFKFSNFFKNILRQEDNSFKMYLQNIINIYGKIDSDKLFWIGDIKLTSSNKKENYRNIISLRKLMAMSAMGGQKYIKYSKKIDIYEIKKGIRIFFSFEVE